MKRNFVCVLLVVLMSLSSCSILTTTSTHRDFNVNAPYAVPVFADLEVSNSKIKHFYAPSKSVRIGGEKNVINSAVRDALSVYGDADVLVGIETQVTYEYFLFFKRISSVVVTGFPATYKSFRSLDEETWYETPYFQTQQHGKR